MAEGLEEGATFSELKNSFLSSNPSETLQPLEDEVRLQQLRTVKTKLSAPPRAAWARARPSS